MRPVRPLRRIARNELFTPTPVRIRSSIVTRTARRTADYRPVIKGELVDHGIVVHVQGVIGRVWQPAMNNDGVAQREPVRQHCNYGALKLVPDVEAAPPIVEVDVERILRPEK